MGFDKDSWKSQIAAYFKSHAPQLRQAGTDALYGLVMAGVLLPAISAFQTGDAYPMMLELSTLLGNISGGLISNLIHSLKDKTDEEIAREINETPQREAALQQAMDALLEKLDVVTVVQQTLSEADRQWFVETLQAELQKSNSQLSINTGGAPYIQGNVITTEFIARDQIFSQVNYQIFHLNPRDSFPFIPNWPGEFGYTSPDSASNAFIRSYFSALAKHCQELELERIHQRLARPKIKARLSLDVLYTDLNVLRPPQDQELNIRRLSAQLEFEDSGDRQPLMAVIADPDQYYFMLLGVAGSGKTTFVNYLTFALAKAASGEPLENGERATKLPENLQGLLPVRIILKHVAADISPKKSCSSPDLIWGAIEKDMKSLIGDDGTAEAFKAFQQLILTQGVMILLDGLDEVPEAGGRRKCLLESVQAWLNCFTGPKPRVLFTARPYAYEDPELRIPGCEMLFLSPFNKEQINHFVDQWYRAVGPVIGWDENTTAGRSKALKEAIESRPYLARLAGRPLLLTLAAAIDSEDGKLPVDRSGLYEEAVNLLLLRWQRGSEIHDSDGTPSDPQIALVQAIPEDKKRRALEELAFNVHQRQANPKERSAETADIPAKEIYGVFSPLVPEVNATILLKFIEDRTGLLVVRNEKFYTFLHRSFQEYLAGCYLLNQDNFTAQMRSLLESDQDWWRDVYLLAMGATRRTLSYALDILEEFVTEIPTEECLERITPERQRLAMLTGMALLELQIQERTSNSRRAGRVKDWTAAWLVNILRTTLLPLQERVNAGNILADLGDPRFREVACYLPHGSHDPWHGFIHIPAGEFLMGSNRKLDPNASNEVPQHPVTLDSYYIARHPVTVAQFRTFVERSHHKPKNPDCLNGLSNHPVVWVTWHDALAYCNWLTGQLAQLPNLASELRRGWRVTLPSEAEWERAARDQKGQIYPWGDTFDLDKANTKESNIIGTSAVGCSSTGASLAGLLDASGNVWEWTRSLWGEYPYPAPGSERRKRESLSHGRRLGGRVPLGGRVVRGGSWYDDMVAARCASRREYDPALMLNNIGFRIALCPESGEEIQDN